MAKKEEVVVEAEFSEVEAPEVETTEQDGQPIKTGVLVAITEAGDLHFQLLGSDQNLLTVEGLLKYADKHMAKVWEARLAAPDAPEAE